MLRMSDLVLFNKYPDDYDGDKRLRTHIGMLIKTLENNKHLIVYYEDKSYKTITASNTSPFSTLVFHRSQLAEFYDNQIECLHNKIKQISTEVEEKEKLNKYEDIKSRLLINCQRIIDCMDDDEIINRSKEVASLRSQMVKAECDYMLKIRRHNSSINRNIHSVNIKKEAALQNLSDDAIRSVYGNLLI